MKQLQSIMCIIHKGLSAMRRIISCFKFSNGRYECNPQFLMKSYNLCCKPLKMRPYLCILTFGLILFACSHKRIESIDGSWRFEYNGQILYPFFPFELYFEEGSLILIDGHSFKHHVRYQIIEDSIEMIFSK